jgi:peptidoglycan/LPS O-acetylase OafA/YrhL
MTPGRIQETLAFGRTGVTLFFLISGFVLYRPMVSRALAGQPPVALREYARRRTLRIFPTYWAWLAIFATSGLVSDVGIRSFALLQIYSSNPFGGINSAWSLCTEVSFYALLPIWARAAGGLLGTRRLRELWVLFAVAVLAVGFQHWSQSHSEQVAWSLTLPANMDWFALGMGLAIISAQPCSTAHRIITTVVRGRELLILAGVALAGVALAQVGGDPHVLQGLVCVPILAVAVFSGRRAPLAWRGLTSVGLVSYSVYLIHEPIALWLQGHVTHSFFGVLALTATLVAPLSIASYRFLERPFMRLGHAGRAKRAAAAA